MRQGADVTRAAGRHPNNLRAVRQRLGWKQERTILELERQAAGAGVRTASRSSLKTELSRWANGHKRISAEYRALFRLIYRASDEELGFRSGLQDETIDPTLTGVSFLNGWEDSFTTSAQEWTKTVERREFLKGMAYAASSATTPALQWLVSGGEVLDHVGSQR